MKVEGPGKTTGANVSRTRKKSGAGGMDFDSLISEAGESRAAAPATAVGNIDSLLSLQSAGDFSGSDAAKKQAQERAESLLDEMDKLRIGMLNGAVPRGNLVALAKIIQSHRGRITDPQLMAVLDEIDLRAQVELAKFTSKD